MTANLHQHHGDTAPNKLRYFTITTLLLSFALWVGYSNAVRADQADVIDVKVSQHEDKSWRFDVTVQHDDEGWHHYVTEWLVVSEERKILAKRTIYHPHVREKPFTRSLKWVNIPEKNKRVTIVARDSVHGIKGESMTVDLIDRSQALEQTPRRTNKQTEQRSLGSSDSDTANASGKARQPDS